MKIEKDFLQSSIINLQSSFLTAVARFALFDSGIITFIGEEGSYFPMKLYLDMNIYKRSFDDQTQIRIKLETMAINIIFQLAEQNQCDIYWSFILNYENSLNPSIERQRAAIALSMLCMETILPDESIQKFAYEIERHSTIPPRDALHLSCAEFANCQYFITCDDKLIRRFKCRYHRFYGRTRTYYIWSAVRVRLLTNGASYETGNQ